VRILRNHFAALAITNNQQKQYKYTRPIKPQISGNTTKKPLNKRVFYAIHLTQDNFFAIVLAFKAYFIEF
jgi:hypothetical protein